MRRVSLCYTPLKSVKEYWNGAELELAVFKNKCNVIRGWDEIFSQIDEHLSSLTSMKMSPFYKTFEETATAWENKLRDANQLLDTWMDVQRRWVYLEGIFFGAGDIQQLLPQEYSRFKSIDSDFVALMKKSSQSGFSRDFLGCSSSAQYVVGMMPRTPCG